MFLSRLNLDQRKAFLALSMKIIGSDGAFEPRERQLIEAMRYEMALFTETDIPKGYVSVEEMAKTFDTRQSQVILMLECIALAYSDEMFHEEEQKILRELALIFNFTEAEATAMENWTLRYKALVKEAVDMFTKI
ncbi:MAG: TerB family tellurite resistance protein [Acidobacteria bacterium]|jgi:tellurite resistance protein|nr:TerB family tellurite resistance protein [Acidobacteriota bacterium]